MIVVQAPWISSVMINHQILLTGGRRAHVDSCLREDLSPVEIHHDESRCMTSVKEYDVIISENVDPHSGSIDNLH